MEKEVVISIRELYKVYKGGINTTPVQALKGISFDIFRGEVFGLLGPNGSGKTTTIKILLGLLFPTKGTCSIFGYPPSNVEVKSRIGFLPEESYLYRFLNAHETLDFYGSLSGMPRKLRKARAADLIKMVGLAEAADRPLKGYSKGMSRRIGLASALISDPELVILDEPTSGLDPIGTREIKDLVKDLGSQGRTVLLCSHLLADVEDVCDRIAILSKGNLAKAGTVGDLLQRTDRFELVTEELEETEKQELLSFVAKLGKNVHRATHPRRKLEDLFLEVVSSSKSEETAQDSDMKSGEGASE